MEQGTERWEEMDRALHGDQDLAGIRKIIQSLLEKKRYLACYSASLFFGAASGCQSLEVPLLAPRGVPIPQE